MAVRVPWDEYETALLLKYCLKVESGEMSRNDAVAFVSNTLRERAQRNGIEIDEIFRNINGISMQMSSIRNCYLEKSHGLTVSKLFHNVVSKYKNDPESLERILQEEGVEMDNTKWQKFLLWLKKENANQEKEVLSSLSMISIFALKNKQLQKPINEISDLSELEHLHAVLQRSGALGIHSKKILGRSNRALNLYVEFLRKESAEDEYIDIQPENIADEKKSEESDFVVDFSVSRSYAHTKPISCLYKNQAVPCGGWNALFVNFTRLVFEEYRECFTIPCVLTSSSRVDIGNADGMRYPKEIADGIYLECNVSATGIVNRLRRLCDVCEIHYDDVLIEYRSTTGEKRSIEKRNVAPVHTVERMLQYTDILRNLLSKRYKYGFRLESPIELMRLRNYAEEENVSFAISDEELQREVSAAGINIDGKIFAVNEALLNDIATLTDNIFASGVTAIFLTPFMNSKEEWLSDRHITTEDMLKAFLKQIRPAYYYGQNMITSGERLTEHEATVKEILRISVDNPVIRVDEIKERLCYIPEEKISWSLSVCPDFVWISEGKYFRMDHFVISEDEVETIAEYVAAECDSNGYASITDLPLNNIWEENYELSETAIHTAVFNTVLKDDGYYLNGKIITREANGVDICELLRRHCNGKLHCTASELMGYAEELTGAPNKQNVMSVLYDTMIRVSADDFVADGQISFDVDAVDTLLNEMVGDQFAPIRSVATYALFPACGVSWNAYVLESFCYRFSNNYRLEVINYNDKNAGLIVAKTLTMTYMEMLCEAAAYSDIELTPDAVGQYFFENGFTAKRKYTKMPDIIEQAKKIREES